MKSGACYLTLEHPKPKSEHRSCQTRLSRKQLKSCCDSQAPDPGDGHLGFIGQEAAKQIVPSKHLSTVTTEEQKTIFSPAGVTPVCLVSAQGRMQK